MRSGLRHYGNKTHTASKKAAKWPEWGNQPRAPLEPEGMSTDEKPTGQAGGFAGILFGEGQSDERAQSQSHFYSLPGPTGVIPPLRSQSGAKKKGGGVGIGGAAETPDSLPGEPPTSEP